MITAEKLQKELDSITAQEKAAYETYHRCQGARFILQDLLKQDLKDAEALVAEENRKLVEAAKAEEIPNA